VLSARYDVIVLGVGAMGSATVYQLARRGKRVLGLERYDIPHAMGSSHGHTRIIRLAYSEDPSYVVLLQRSYELWRSIQARAGERLLHITGSVDAGPSNSWVFKGSLQSCLQHELPHQVLTSKELAERFPGYRLPHETLAVLQPEGGFLLPERCIVAYVTAAQAEGAEVHGRERVLDWLPLGDGVRVITDHGVYETDHLVVTAGAWNAKLLPFLEGLAVPERQVLAWLQPQHPELFTPDRSPSSTSWSRRAASTASPVSACQGSSSADITTSRRPSTPTWSNGSRAATTRSCCAGSPPATSQAVLARPCRWPSACSPTPPTTTSSSTGIRTTRRCRSRRRARGTGSSSPA